MSYREVNYDEAIKTMQEIRKETEDVGIFTDRGWGDDFSINRIYDIIKDGNGQKPIANISKDVFTKLRKNNIIGENILQTYKDRTFHLFQGEE